VTPIGPGPLGGVASCVTVPTLSDAEYTGCYRVDRTTIGVAGTVGKGPGRSPISCARPPGHREVTGRMCRFYWKTFLSGWESPVI
jgi:hypothetical protein